MAEREVPATAAAASLVTGAEGRAHGTRPDAARNEYGSPRLVLMVKSPLATIATLEAPGVPGNGRCSLMTMPSAESGTRLFGRPLSRRRALAQTGVGLAALGSSVVTGARPSVILAQEASPPADEPPSAEVTGGVTPKRAALAVERLPALAETILQQSGVPGMAVAVVYDDNITFADGFGVREIGKEGIATRTPSSSWPRSPDPGSYVVSSDLGDGAVAWKVDGGSGPRLRPPRCLAHTERISGRSVFASQWLTRSCGGSPGGPRL